MARVNANGIEIEYETQGNPSGPALLLISGYTAQLIRWPQSFIEGLAATGRYVIYHDNRDIGLSTEFAGREVPPFAEIIHALQGGCPPQHLVPYLVSDMAADAAALLDTLGVAKADVLGMSMGGMIAQLMALNHPEKVRKLIPMMTTSGDPSLPPGDPEAMKTLNATPKSRAPEDIADAAVVSARAIGSDASVRNPDDEVRLRSLANTARSDRPGGIVRQYAAILAQPRWHQRLGEISHPTMVMHGAVDPLIRPASGKDIAARIPGARYVEIEKWGHDLPELLIPEIVRTIDSFLLE
jgi:pimeloyl-ACP methyl ester carboxylesterase